MNRQQGGGGSVRDDQTKNQQTAQVQLPEQAAEIPEVVIRRLPIYARILEDLLTAGIGSIASNDLAERIGVTAAQIRRDLSYFGRFGKQGKGYDIALLLRAIWQILNLTQTWQVALVGFGHLGQAIAHYRGFQESNFQIAAIFDNNPEKVGQPTGIAQMTVLPEAQIAEVVAAQQIKIGIIAVPAAAAQHTAEMLIQGQVIALLNYAPIVLQVPDSICVRDIDPITTLQSMAYYLDKPYHRSGTSATLADD